MKRRQFIKSASTGICLFPLLISACQNTTETADPCQDFSKLTETDLKIRKSLSYVEESPYEDQLCDNCAYWIAPKEGLSCGGCVSIQGPILPKAYCSYWAPNS